MSINLSTNSIDTTEIKAKESCTPSLTQNDSAENSDSLDSEIEEIEDINEEIYDRELYADDPDSIPTLEETSQEEIEDNFDIRQFSFEAKEFYKVFIEGNFANSKTSQKLELSEEVLKQFFPSPFDKAIKRRLPAHIKLVKYNKLQRSLKPISNTYYKQDRPDYKPKPKGIKWSVQNSSCQKFPRGFEKCLNCNKREFESCRFKGIRTLAYKMESKIDNSIPKWQVYTKKGVDGPIYTNSSLESEDDSEDEEALLLEEYEKANHDFPDIPLISLTDVDETTKSQYNRHLLNQSSSSFLNLLSVQLSLFKYTKIYLKRDNEPHHHQCDNCKDTIINIYYLSKHCGIEICYRCYLKGDISNLATYCARTYIHPMTDFIPVTLYPIDAFQSLYDSCKKLADQEDQPQTLINDDLFDYNGNDFDNDDSERLYNPYVRGTEEEIGLEDYQNLMKNGSPFVVEDVSEENLEYFSAENFKKYYGDFEVNQLENHSGDYQTVTFNEFFQNFDTYDSDLPPITFKKIIDYPSFADYKTVFPKLHNAFLNALPFKHCTSPKGILNLASYLPDILHPPDFGPKMYISTSREHRNEVTTPLSIESTDSVYIMTHSYEPDEDEPRGIQCAALWNIFESKDIDKIREYLTFHPQYLKLNTDPIYSQEVFFTKKMLMELKEEFDVKSYQIYQNPGDCIFIPSGCAYQMVSFSNCIQISTGFISSERATQSLNIAHELSQLPKNHPRNGDFAQVENHILFSCSNAISQLLNESDILIDCIRSKYRPKSRKTLEKLNGKPPLKTEKRESRLIVSENSSDDDEPDEDFEEVSEIEVKHEHSDGEFNCMMEKDLSLMNLLESGTLSAKAKDFIKVFVKGDYVKNTSMPGLEIYEDLVKMLIPSKSDFKTVEENMPSSVKLYYPLNRRKNGKKELEFHSEPKNEVNSHVEWVLQETTCHRFPREIWCAACVTKQKDQCRFKGVRMITLDSENTAKASFRWQEYSDLASNRVILSKNIKKNIRESRYDIEIRNIVEIYTDIDKKLPDIKRNPIVDISESIRKNHLKYLLKQCSTSLKGLIDLQLDLFNFKTVHFKSIPLSGQHICDNCSISILNVYFLNTHCGIELCVNCYLMDNKSNIGGKCFDTYEHPMTDFIPVTIFPKDVIQWLKDGCNELIKEEELPVSTVDQKLFVYNGKDIDEEEIDRLYKPYLRGAEEEIGLENYQLLMQQGVPLVVKDVGSNQLNHFGAEALKKYYGNVEVEQLLDGSDFGKKVKLSEFLSDFVKCKAGKKKVCKQINDWPSFSDFKTAFPKLYNAFLNALPFKSCTQPDGSLNLTSYLPKVLNPPDLGPKLYITTGNGTTNLSMGSSDAVYIMTHSYRSGYELPHSQYAALWHVFKYEDAEKTRMYLNKSSVKNISKTNDCIHDQEFYLTESMLNELRKKYGVRAYQIYQNPGDAVFIPAGCAYQILNLSNNIQISTGYISPERVIQTIHVTNEFSKLPKNHPKNGDIAQVENHIVYSCSHAISTLSNTEDKLLDQVMQSSVSTVDKKISRDHLKRKSNEKDGSQREKKSKLKNE